MTDLLTLRRELLALLADMASDLELIREKVEAIISEIERRGRTARDSSQGQPE